MIPTDTLNHIGEAEHRAELSRRAKRAGLELVGTGVFRAVYALDESRVVKFQKAKAAGVAANCMEVLVWRRAAEGMMPGLASFLAPIVAHPPNYRWVVMPRAEPLSADDKRWRDFFDDVEDVGYQFRERKRESLGVIEGAVRCFDYHGGVDKRAPPADPLEEFEPTRTPYEDEVEQMLIDAGEEAAPETFDFEKSEPPQFPPDASARDRYLLAITRRNDHRQER